MPLKACLLMRQQAAYLYKSKLRSINKSKPKYRKGKSTKGELVKAWSVILRCSVLPMGHAQWAQYSRQQSRRWGYVSCDIG
jgi:hypothetical protein